MMMIMKKAKIQLAIKSQINEVLKNKVHLSELPTVPLPYVMLYT